jgi:hypothetical protein
VSVQAGTAVVPTQSFRVLSTGYFNPIKNPPNRKKRFVKKPLSAATFGQNKTLELCQNNVVINIGTLHQSTYSAYLRSLCFHKGQGGFPQLTVHLSTRVAADTPPPPSYLSASVSKRILPSPNNKRLDQWNSSFTRLLLRSRMLRPE